LEITEIEKSRVLANRWRRKESAGVGENAMKGAVQNWMSDVP
jgi:hypothetical protein